jgi:hypothetical protein
MFDRGGGDDTLIPKGEFGTRGRIDSGRWWVSCLCESRERGLLPCLPITRPDTIATRLPSMMEYLDSVAGNHG